MLIAFAAGGLLGFFFGWLIGSRARAAVPDSRLENELRQQVGQRETELTQLRAQLTETGNARAAAEARHAASEKMLVEQRALQDKALIDLREAFKALSAEALKQSAPEFLRLAEQSFGKLQETAKGDLAQRQESIKTLVEPLKQQLETYQKRLQQSEAAQSSTLGEVKKQLELLSQQSQSLASETLQFRRVLSSNQARGRWGEETLRRVVEAAGMSAHCDFTEQTQAGENRPDLVVRLPGDRFIIVDAKVPDFDFLNALESADDAKRAEALAAHAAKLKATIKALADRDYPSQFPNALDYVVLFVPAESLFSAALEGDHDLIVWAAEQTNFAGDPGVAHRAAAFGERELAAARPDGERAENRRSRAGILFARGQIHRTLRENPRRAGAGEHGLQRCGGAVFKRRVRPAGERLAELGGANSAKELADVQPLDSTLRLPPNSGL